MYAILFGNFEYLQAVSINICKTGTKTSDKISRSFSIYAI